MIPPFAEQREKVWESWQTLQNIKSDQKKPQNKRMRERFRTSQCCQCMTNTCFVCVLLNKPTAYWDLCSYILAWIILNTFLIVFFFSDVNVCWPPYTDMSGLCLPPPPLCSDIAASGITVSILFKMAPIKCFCFFFQVNEGHLILLSSPKEVSQRQKLIAFLFMGIYSVWNYFHIELFIYFLNKHMSRING